MRRYLDGHIGDLILFAAFLLCLIAHTTAVLLGKTDQTLAGAVLGTLGALGAYMQKRVSTTAKNDSATTPEKRSESDPDER